MRTQSGKRVTEVYRGYLPWDSGEDKWARDHFKARHGTGTQHVAGFVGDDGMPHTVVIPISASTGVVFIQPSGEPSPFQIHLRDIWNYVESRNVRYFFAKAFQKWNSVDELKNSSQ